MGSYFPRYIRRDKYLFRRSWPISRVLSWTVIPLGAGYPCARAAYPRARRAASSPAYLVLLRMEVAAFHPLPVTEATRLCGPVPRLRPHWRRGRYPASRSVEPGLSSPASMKNRRRLSSQLRGHHIINQKKKARKQTSRKWWGAISSGPAPAQTNAASTGVEAAHIGVLRAAGA